ncbi:MAG: hypothetical protein JWM37_753 [Candidatus Saccharibacteria bacterium]|nr:hypothetical protein [Candidatus Saccharibacteria bacterium]
MNRTLVAALPAKADAVNGLWWVNMIEAALALFFGISAIFWPGLTLITLVYLFSGFILGLGIVQVISAIMSIRSRGTWWVTMLLGIISIGLGVYLVRHPGLSMQTFLLLVGLLLVARGVLDIVRVFSDRATTPDGIPRILMAIFGVAAIIAGIFVLVQPVAGGVAFVWILGIYALIFGTLNMALAVELRAALFGPTTQSEAETTDRRADQTAAGQSSGSRAPRTPKRTGPQPV